MIGNRHGDDPLDRELRSALRARVDEIGNAELNTGTLMRAVRKDRVKARVRYVTLAVGATVAAVALVGIIRSENAPSDDGARIASDPTNGQPTSASSSVPADGGYDSLPAADRAVLMQLMSRPEVRQQLLGVANPSDLVLCSLDHIGRESANLEYIWLYCGTYTTGDHAENISGGADPAIIELRAPSTHDVEVVSIEFPRTAFYDADIQRMFPTATRERIMNRDVEIAPSEQELLAIARNTP